MILFIIDIFCKVPVEIIIFLNIVLRYHFPLSFFSSVLSQTQTQSPLNLALEMLPLYPSFYFKQDLPLTHL